MYEKVGYKYEEAKSYEKDTCITCPWLSEPLNL